MEMEVEFILMNSFFLVVHFQLLVVDVRLLIKLILTSCHVQFSTSSRLTFTVRYRTVVYFCMKNRRVVLGRLYMTLIPYQGLVNDFPYYTVIH